MIMGSMEGMRGKIRNGDEGGLRIWCSRGVRKGSNLKGKKGKAKGPDQEGGYLKEVLLQASRRFINGMG